MILILTIKSVECLEDCLLKRWMWFPSSSSFNLTAAASQQGGVPVQQQISVSLNLEPADVAYRDEAWEDGVRWRCFCRVIRGGRGPGSDSMETGTTIGEPFTYPLQRRGGSGSNGTKSLLGNTWTEGGSLKSEPSTQYWRVYKGSVWLLSTLKDQDKGTVDITLMTAVTMCSHIYKWRV